MLIKGRQSHQPLTYLRLKQAVPNIVQWVSTTHYCNITIIRVLLILWLVNELSWPLANMTTEQTSINMLSCNGKWKWEHLFAATGHEVSIVSREIKDTGQPFVPFTFNRRPQVPFYSKKNSVEQSFSLNKLCWNRVYSKKILIRLSMFPKSRNARND